MHEDLKQRRCPSRICARALAEALEKLGVRKKVLALPPDYTRFHSHAGILTRLAWEYYGTSLTDILPRSARIRR